MINTFLLFLMVISVSADGFKLQQKKFKRVRIAYAEKETAVKSLLNTFSVNKDELEIYLRAFKREKELELWGKNQKDQQFKLIKTYKICNTSGLPGPKRKQGDLQIPEGFYHINVFNPLSKFYLSLGINYPNDSDRVLSDKKHPGDHIYIHGDCVTIGCLPITDDQIKELYIFCIEAKNNGQETIPVTMFPARLTDEKYQQLLTKYKDDSDRIHLWSDLKKGYDLFNQNKQLFSVNFLKDGRHKLR